MADAISIFQMPIRYNRANTVKYMYHEETAEHTFYLHGQDSFLIEVIDWCSNTFGKSGPRLNDANQWFVQSNSITFYNQADAEFFTLKWN